MDSTETSINKRVYAKTSSSSQENVKEESETESLVVDLSGNDSTRDKSWYMNEDGTINFDRVKEAAKSAQIHDYISNTKYGYQTIVGERGIQLSGGQKQRVGIARAFYRKSQILILDEATSALDQKTESSIINTIHAFDFPITLIMVAHRVTSLSECDRIYRIENQKIIEAEKI